MVDLVLIGIELQLVPGAPGALRQVKPVAQLPELPSTGAGDPIPSSGSRPSNDAAWVPLTRGHALFHLE